MNDAMHNKSTAYLVKRLVGNYVRPYIGRLLLALLIMAISAGMTAILALLMEPILDDAWNPEGTGDVYMIAVLVLGVFIIRGLTGYVHVLMTNKIGQFIVADVQKDLFSQFMRLDLGFFHENPSGQLISRVISDVNVMRMALSDTLTGLGKSLLTMIFLIGVMFSKDWQLTIAALCLLPFASFFMAYIGKRLRKLSGTTLDETANLSDKLSQIFQGIRQVHAYGMEEHERNRAASAIDRVRNLNIKSVRISNMSTPANETMVGIVMCAVIVYGGSQISDGTMTPGQIAAFITAFVMAYEPMKKLARLNNTLQIGLGAAERVFGLMDLEPRIQNAPNAKTLEVRRPDIVFNDVSFSYDGTASKALNNISFQAKPGKVTALVGPSGGGKTTIMNLIPRFYDPAEGFVLIGGEDTRALTIESLRSHIALVSQDITIFDESLLMNIQYGRHGASKEEVIDAAKAAYAHEFISEFEDGYDTLVGENGVKLSGGQRQRIAIARAILRDAPVLLLDEATSALDNESERAVQDALEVLEEGRTTIVIAHRLTTVQNADQIIVLDQGRIVEQGKHKDLMKQKGLYAKMYERGLQE